MESLHNKNQTTSDSPPQEVIPCNPLLVYHFFFQAIDGVDFMKKLMTFPEENKRIITWENV
jgi:hypothetical protein